MTNQDRETISLYVELAQYFATLAQLQDNLLQSYRQIFIAVESIFMALAIAIISFQPINEGVLGSIMILTAIGLIMIFLWRYIVNDRAKWVDWWHKKLLNVERELPEGQKAFTEFKREQKKQTQKNDEEDLLSHGRKSIRNIFNFIMPTVFAATWISILLLALYFTYTVN